MIIILRSRDVIIGFEYGFTKREKKRSFLKSLKILYVKKMSQRQKGMHHIGKLSAAEVLKVLESLLELQSVLE
ncbi:hypothetical protein P8452_76830 [Trifolium repens]|nr:hypothetical protein P8452_76830 [Trifolium repens]